MPTTKKPTQYFFICQQDDEDVFIEDKDGVDSRIKSNELHDEDLDFKVIGRIPRENLTVDFNPSIIDWYTDEMYDKSFIDRTILKIIQAITYGV